MRRALSLVITLATGLCACGGPDPRAPFTDSRIPPGLEHRFYPPQGWAWGLIKPGKAPAVRYGVAAPRLKARAQVLILPGYGEPAEAWFETANELVAQGYVVWVLEAAGQGGSGRYALPRDLGHAPSLDPDVAALLAFPARVARDRPLFVLASGEAAPTALRAAELGLRADGLFLSAPVLDAGGNQDRARQMRRFGLGGLRADGAKGWRRAAADARARDLTGDPVRGRLRVAWQTANPDLRMGGPSWAWRAAFADEAGAASAGKPRIAMPVMLFALGGASESRLCDRIPVCTAVAAGKAGRAPHLEQDDVRAPWLAALLIFIAPDRAALAPAPPPATVEPDS